MDDNQLINEAYLSKKKKEPVSEARMDSEVRFYVNSFSEEAEGFASTIASACYAHFSDESADYVFETIKRAVIKTLNQLSIESFENPYDDEDF